MKLVVVLGYSDRRSSGGLHRICTARLERAAALSTSADAVVLTGRPEAELMLRAWRGPAAEVLCDTGARITAESAAHVVRLVGELGVDEVLVVTSWWHRARAGIIFRSLLRGTDVPVLVASAPTWTLRLLLREAAAFLLVPLQLRRARAG